MVEPSTIPTQAKPGGAGPELARGLRVSEKLVLGFFIYVVLAAALFPLSWRERLAILGLNLLASTVILLLSRFGTNTQSEFLAVVRDWFPCVLILVAYRESGLFFTPDPSHRFDYLFEKWDFRLLHHGWVLGVLSAGSPWIQHYLELSYFFAYPLVPFGLGALYLARRWPALTRGCKFSNDPKTIDHFWTAVLLGLLFCYVVYPLFPLTPPRILFGDFPGPPVNPLLRKMNFWILGRYGVQACIFPSGHVAAVTATAFTVRYHLPRVGAFFLIAALSVAVATVYGRYHYTADALAGALIGSAAFLVSTRLHRDRSRG